MYLRPTFVNQSGLSKASVDHTESSTTTMTSVESQQEPEAEIDSEDSAGQYAFTSTSNPPSAVGGANVGLDLLENEDRHETYIDLDAYVEAVPVEEKEGVEQDGSGNNGGDESSSDDEDADLKSIHRFKQHMNRQQSEGSLRRVDSLERFVTRSVRMSILGKDQPPPAEIAAKRTVRFRPDEDLEQVLVLQALPEEKGGDNYMSQYHMTDADFARNDADMKLTHFRWENHLSGNIRFDESESTLRGLEFMNPQEQLIRDRQKLKHQQRVLEESLMCITANLYQDKPLLRSSHQWEKLRQASLENSTRSLHEAQARARQDHIDYCKSWGVPCELKQDDATSLDRTFGIHAGATANLRGKHEQQQKQRQPKNGRAVKTNQRKNPLLFWKKT